LKTNQPEERVKLKGNRGMNLGGGTYRGGGRQIQKRGNRTRTNKRMSTNQRKWSSGHVSGFPWGGREKGRRFIVPWKVTRPHNSENPGKGRGPQTAYVQRSKGRYFRGGQRKSLKVRKEGKKTFIGNKVCVEGNPFQAGIRKSQFRGSGISKTPYRCRRLCVR